MSAETSEPADPPGPQKPDKSFLRAMGAYRKSLLELQEDMQTEYDKTVLTLSGGAFGITAMMVKDIIGTARAHHAISLLCAWGLWALSIAAVLYSYFTSATAMEAVVLKVDLGLPLDDKPGGQFDRLTRVLNLASGALFLGGLCSFGYFVFTNL